MTVPSLVRGYPASGTLGASARTITTAIDTTGLGANGAVVVGFSYQGKTGGSQVITGVSVSACTLDGVALTAIKAFVINAGSTTAGAALYGILAPASSATASLVITVTGDSAGTPGLTVNVAVLQDVASFGNNATYNDGSGTTGNQAISVTAAATALAVAMGYHGDTISGVGASTTIVGVANNLDNTSAGGCGIGGTRTGVGGSTTLTFNSAVTDHWTIHAVELVGTSAAAPSAGPSTPAIGDAAGTRAGLLPQSFIAVASLPPSTTTVGTTVGTTWNTLAAVAPTRATTWNVAASVVTTRATTWNVLGAVTTTRATTWNVTAAVAVTRATTWNTTATVGTTRATTWNVTVAVALTRATTWDTLGAVVTTRSTTWNVASSLTTVGTTRATTWNTLALVVVIRSTTWNVLVVSTATIFRPPVVRDRSYGPERLWRHIATAGRGVNVYQLANGSYVEIEPPPGTVILRTYLGGHDNPITPAEAASLTAAGYAANLS